MIYKSPIYNGPSLNTEDQSGVFPGKALSQFGEFRRGKYNNDQTEVERETKDMTDEDCRKIVMDNKEKIMSDFREWVRSN